MDLIVTHKNADFDALSSLVAASKLYPKARLLLPGSQEKAVRSFLSLIKDKIDIEKEKTCRMDDVTRMIIVDNRHRSRIGGAAALLDKKGMRVHIFDHHPRTRFDIKAEKDVFKEVGATVSILIEILAKKKKLKFTPLEATLMLLGIYEETGSLSYSTTTRLDVDMVSLLLKHGASLNSVSSYLNRELNESELSALIDLLGSVDAVDVNGVNVAFADVDISNFDGETGTVVHKFQDVENYPVIFAMFTHGEKTKILARSRVESIDVNKLLAHLGGAGHTSAASAKVENISVKGIKAEILNILKKMTQPDIYAGDIMSFPVKTFSQEEKVTEVLAELDRIGYRGAPVLNSDSELVGMITEGDLKKAIKRGIGHSRIKGYMGTQLITANPETPLCDLQKILLKKNKGRIPVIDGNKLIGIVTRTDVLKKVHTAFFPASGEGLEVMNILNRMKSKLPKKLMKIIRDIGSLADDNGMNTFLVGGFVRDIIMDSKNYDLDLVVEGDAIKFGKILADEIGGSLVVHKKFGTSTVVTEWPKWLGPALHPNHKFKIDIATARKEIYEKPAALPTVEFSSLREDLYRRDFTINAMALSLNKNNFGLFIDFFGGMKDLKKGVIRILHDKSFMDDPTRIFRAVRFEQRLGFTIDKHTEYLITHAIKKEMFRRTENQRIRDELVLILKERDPEKAVFRMRELHELRFIHSNLTLKRSIRSMFTNLRKCIKWYEQNASGQRKLDVWLMNLMLVLEKLNKTELREVVGKFVFTRSEGMRLRSYKDVSDRVLRSLSTKKKMLPSQVYALLEPLAHEVTVYMLAKTASQEAGRRIKKFFTEYNGTKLKIKGQDIKKEGLKPGPEYGEMLKKVLFKKIDGKLPDKKSELKYLRELIKKSTSAPVHRCTR